MSMLWPIYLAGRHDGQRVFGVVLSQQLVPNWSGANGGCENDCRTNSSPQPTRQTTRFSCSPL